MVWKLVLLTASVLGGAGVVLTPTCLSQDSDLVVETPPAPDSPTIRLLRVAFAGSTADDMLPPALPRIERKFRTNGYYRGVVRDTGPDWLEVAGGWTGFTRNGVKQWDEKDSKKHRRISTAGTIPGGKANGDGRGLDTYRLSNLKVGDVVTIETGITFGGEEYCLRIDIWRRPGGTIPRRPREEELGFPVRDGEDHLRNQAEQDWEEKGVPIPKRFLDPQGREPWTNPPYPPLAPQPRPAKS